MRKTWLIVIALLMACAAAWWWAARPPDVAVEPPQPKSGTAIAALARQALTRITPAVKPSRNTDRSMERGNARYLARIPQGLREKLQRRRELREQAFDANDLHAFVQSILLAARGGDVEAQAAIADALLECESFETSKQGPNKQTYRELVAENSAAPRLLDFARREISRCETLARAPTDEVGEQEDWLRQAALAGHGPSMLGLNALPETATADEAASAVHQAIATGDPDVLLDLISVYSTDGDQTKLKRSDQAYLALATKTLVGCDLGEDCSNRNINFRLACRVGDCGTASDEIDRVRATLSDELWEQAQTHANQLIEEFYGGRYDWPEAQTYENTIRDAAKSFAANSTPSPSSSVAGLPQAK